MTEIVIKVKDSETKFIKNLLKKFDFVHIRSNSKPKISAASKRILDNLEGAVHELNLYKEGKIELQDWDDLKEEMKREGYL